MILHGQVWIFVETLDPKRWGVRVGNRWLTARKLTIGRVPFETCTQCSQPRMYLRSLYTCVVGKHGDVIAIA